MKLDFATLIFARQMIFVHGPLQLPAQNRLPPLVEAAQAIGKSFSSPWLETADANEAKDISGFCRKFDPHLKKALVNKELLKLEKSSLPRMHVCFLDSSTAYAGISRPGNSSNWPISISSYP